ncbi:MAG: HD domain-containing protein [Clostridia bacterium]|nr:HD domain-containing protein [Clostridia bacterium]MDE7328915.1 HD domain-containing protein [Clostridia bacterium]
MTDLNENAKKELQRLYEHKDGLLSAYATKDGAAIRKEAYSPKLFRRQFIRDCEVVINLPLFNRYAGKTQVFSLSGNDDVSTRAYHVQLVSRIARTIGSALSLNVDLIEAIALAHDLGHCPFGHLGEKLLDNAAQTRSYRFAHHVQGARYLNEIVKSNISLQVVDGVLCHNGEKVLQHYAPNKNSCKSFSELEDKLQLAYRGELNDENLMASTLEGCLVRIADVIAYVGKDRQDAQKLKLVDFSNYERNALGKFNHEIIANLSIDIINNSLGKNHIALSDSAYEELTSLMKDNYAKIYTVSKIDGYGKDDLQKIVNEVYAIVYDDITGDRSLVDKYYQPYIYPNTSSVEKYFNENLKFPERMAADFVASMTDRYLLDFHEKITNPKNE